MQPLLGLQAVETANELRVEVGDYREGLDRIDAGQLPSSQIEVASGGTQAAYASEQYREVVRSIAGQDNRLAEQQATMAPRRRGRHADDRGIEGKSALDAELARSGSPQQRIAEGQNRDRDDRER
jgi:phosphoenolpyruvate carboxylase